MLTIYERTEVPAMFKPILTLPDRVFSVAIEKDNDNLYTWRVLSLKDLIGVNITIMKRRGTIKIYNYTDIPEHKIPDYINIIETLF